MRPRLRRRIAQAHVWVSVIAGVYCTVFVARDPYERVLMGISWYAVFATAVDVLQTTDVRVQQAEDDGGPS